MNRMNLINTVLSYFFKIDLNITFPYLQNLKIFTYSLGQKDVTKNKYCNILMPDLIEQFKR
jgi:hypothetical protein